MVSKSLSNFCIAARSFVMFDGDFDVVLCQNVMRQRCSSNTCLIIYLTNAAHRSATCCNTSQVVKLRVHPLQHPLVFPVMV